MVFEIADLRAGRGTAAILAVILCACLALLASCAPASQQQDPASESAPSAAESASTAAETEAPEAPEDEADTAPDIGDIDLAATFPSWNADSTSLRKIVAFVQRATDESGDGYIPPADRVATFDLDGTLICEKDPVYLDYAIMLHRVLDDPTYEPDAETLATCEAIREAADGGATGGMGGQKDLAFARAFAGMTPNELRDYINDFLDATDAECFSGMTYGESAYRPMAEIVDYLHENEFNVYIVTACERAVARAFAETRLGIAPDHVLGSDLGTVATGQGGQDAATYEFTQDDELRYSGEVATNCGQGMKVVYIQREIGKQPVLAFGNSSGDFAMLNYARANRDHPGMGVLVLADDTEREYGDEDAAATMKDQVNAQGWTGISMRDDWSTIYGDSVQKNHRPADEQLAAA